MLRKLQPVKLASRGKMANPTDMPQSLITLYTTKLKAQELGFCYQT